MLRNTSLVWSLSLLVLVVMAAGCSRGPKVVPVQGKVLYNGEPLQFGGVMFQPDGGQPARAEIQPDGSFTLTTHRPGDGATVGRNRVRVTCYESQSGSVSGEGEGESALGRLLIPMRYTNIHTSGIVIEVKSGKNDDVLIELSDET